MRSVPGLRAVTRQLHAGARRVRRHWQALVLAAASAGIAHLVAGMVFGDQEAFFAPIAAVICVSITAGQRVRRAVEITAGVLVGLLAADLLLRVVGPGSWQLALAVLAAMTLAVALRAGALISNQAAVAAVLVMSLSPALGDNPLQRVGDAVVGGATGLALNALFPQDPRRAVLTALDHVLDGITGVLHTLAGALRDRDLEAAETSLDELRAAARGLDDLDQALEAAHEASRLSPQRRRLAATLRPAHLVRERLDLLVVTARGLARATANALRHHPDEAPDLDQVASATDTFAEAIAALPRWARGRVEETAVRDLALQAGVEATATLHSGQARTVPVVVAQLRSGVIDVLRATGADQHSAVAALEGAAGTLDSTPDPGDTR